MKKKIVKKEDIDQCKTCLDSAEQAVNDYEDILKAYKDDMNKLRAIFFIIKDKPTKEPKQK